MAQRQNPLSKVLGVPLSKGMVKNNDGTLLIRGYFTSDNKDELGDIITRSATERAVPRYRQWMNIRYMHQPRPVAKVTRIGSDDGLDWNEVEIKVIDPQAIFEVENGLLTALSVGILVKYEDIDMLEDGGWVINDYQLAEISLVDHPANYDARLKQLPVDQGLRLLAQEYGMTNLARGMQSLLDMEMSMTNDATVLEQEEVQEEQVIEEALEPEPQAEEAQVELSAEAEVAEVAEAEEVGEPVEEVSEQEEEPAPEPEPEVSLFSLFNEIKALRAEVSELRLALEVSAEAPEAEEQAEGDVQVELAAEPEEPEISGEAVDRSAAVPETVLPTEEAVERMETESPVTDLKDALRKYFSLR